MAGIGSALGASSSSKAAGKAADVSQQNNAQNIALQREIYGQNQQTLAPFTERGNAAGAQINALLGLPTGAAPATGGMGGATGVWDQYLQMNPDVMRGWQQTGQAFKTPQEYAQFHYNTYGKNEKRDLPVQLGGKPPASQAPATAGNVQASTDPFEAFRNSTGYQFRLDNALDAVNSGAAGAGVLQSGAAIKAAQDRAADVATDAFGQYAGMLQGQQAVGAGTASSLAGVGQNFANSVTASNNMNASNQANALLVKGQNNPFANLAGVVGGGILGGAFG